MQTENKNGGHLYFQDFYLKDKKGAFFPPLLDELSEIWDVLMRSSSVKSF